MYGFQLHGTFPDNWKTAKIAPIFKAGLKSEMGNYRPTSVLSTVARVFERLSMMNYHLTWNA